MVYIYRQSTKTKRHRKMSKNVKPIKLLPRTQTAALVDLTDDQLARIGELALMR